MKQILQILNLSLYFLSKQILKSHLTSVHKLKKHYEFGSYDFKNSNQMRNISSVRVLKKSFQCEFCGLSFLKN